MLRCPLCGEEANKQDNFCSSCGASLITKNKNSTILSEQSKDRSNSSRTKAESMKDQKNTIAKQELKKANSISSTKLFYLVLFLVVIGAVLIYSTGVFDSTPTTVVPQQTDLNNPHSGVDLKNLEQINLLQGMVDKNPTDKETLLQLAHLYNDSGFKPKAIERYLQYLKMNPNNADVLVDMGVCYFETGNNNDAISSMEKALKINPQHQIANLNLGIVNMTAGNIQKAIGYWNKAIEIDPTNEIGQKAKELITTH